jgi:hypothetical protein
MKITGATLALSEQCIAFCSASHLVTTTSDQGAGKPQRTLFVVPCFVNYLEVSTLFAWQQHLCIYIHTAWKIASTVCGPKLLMPQ